MGNESLRAWGTYDALTAVVNLWGHPLQGCDKGRYCTTQQSHGLLGHRIWRSCRGRLLSSFGPVGLAGRGTGADADRRERGRGPGPCKRVVYTV